jgi:hypothetical protein
VLTAKGRDFFPVLMSLFYWGLRHIPTDEVAMLLGDASSGAERKVAVTDAVTGEQLTPDNTTILAGPAADEAVRERIARMRAWYLGIDA